MPKVLVIDDNEDHIRMTCRALSHSGYDVIVANEGEEGRKLAVEEHPDLILLDLGLPDVDGQTVLGQMRRHAALSDVPIIAVTAWPPDTGARMAEAYGFDGYLSKPITFSTLSEQIAAYLPQGD